MSKVALITGITGQDGSYLAELLLNKGYKVHGIVRRVALDNEDHRFWRIKKIKKELTLHSATLESYASLAQIVKNHELQQMFSKFFLQNGGLHPFFKEENKHVSKVAAPPSFKHPFSISNYQIFKVPPSLGPALKNQSPL